MIALGRRVIRVPQRAPPLFHRADERGVVGAVGRERPLGERSLAPRAIEGVFVQIVEKCRLKESHEALVANDLRAVESLLLQALVHMLKAEAWPTSPAVPGWQAEARLFRAQARRAFAPSMRQRLDVPGLYADALRAMPETIDGQAPLPVPAICPVTLDELLAEG